MVQHPAGGTHNYVSPTAKRANLLGDGLSSVASHDSYAPELAQTNQFIADLPRQLSGRDQDQRLNEGLGRVRLFH
jgi:hypothetical protein